MEGEIRIGFGHLVLVVFELKLIVFTRPY